MKQGSFTVKHAWFVLLCSINTNKRTSMGYDLPILYPYGVCACLVKLTSGEHQSAQLSSMYGQ
eukprot:6185128-Pleurochrysis_carterae.AAC.1